MIEPSNWRWLNQREVGVAKSTAKEAGEYIEEVGKTDLAEWTPEQFETLLLIICNKFAEDQIPF